MRIKGTTAAASRFEPGTSPLRVCGLIHWATTATLILLIFWFNSWKETQTLMSSWLYCKIQKIWVNQWKSERTPMRTDEASAFLKTLCNIVEDRQCCNRVRLESHTRTLPVTRARVVMSHLNFGSSQVIWSHLRVRVESSQSSNV